MPEYEGKGHPPARSGWLRGFKGWWRNLTPQYVTPKVTNITIPASAAVSTTTASGAPDALSSPPATSGDAPSGSRVTVNAACEPSSGESK
jgi:hypothetical protein